MNKIPTLYVRDPSDRRYVTDEITPGCEWVLAGEGVPTRKFDGTCVMLDDEGKWWARREVKMGKTRPPGWEPVQHDNLTGKSVGWESIEQSSFYRWFREALEDVWGADELTPGTYELIGPKINGDLEHVGRHLLVSHAGAMRLDDFDDDRVSNSTPPWTLVNFVGREYGWEGIVWHHPDGRMAKLKYRDLKPKG